MLTGVPSGRNERIFDSNSKTYEEIKKTGKGNYISQYKSQYYNVGL